MKNVRIKIKKSIQHTLEQFECWNNKDMTWNRKTGNIVQVIDFQTIQHKGDPRIRVTFNLGLCAPQVHSLVWPNENKIIYEETDCCPRFRIGYLLSNEEPKFLDKWWEIDDEDDDALRELSDVLSAKAIPWLNQHSNLLSMQKVASKLAITRRMEVVDQVYLAVINHKLGRVNESDAIFADLLSSKRLKKWHFRIKSIQSRLSLF